MIGNNKQKVNMPIEACSKVSNVVINGVTFVTFFPIELNLLVNCMFTHAVTRIKKYFNLNRIFDQNSYTLKYRILVQ